LFTGIGLVSFCCIFGAGLIGILLAGLLPDYLRTDATQKVVQSMMNIVAILSALVLGLLVAGTKTNFDTRSREVEQFAANLTLLDRELIHYGADTKDMRDLLRGFTQRRIALTWPKDRGAAPMLHDDQAVRSLRELEDALLTLTPRNEIQRAARATSLQLTDELNRTSRILAVQQSSQTPRPFLIVVVFWLSMLFLSYAIFAPLNATVIAAMLVCAFSVSAAVNLTFDTDRPFEGFVRISSKPMLQALEQMQP
jgi:Protein of unknown function (DUF4239)